MKKNSIFILLLVIIAFTPFTISEAKQKWKFLRKVDVGTGYRFEYLDTNIQKYQGRVYYNEIWVLKGKNYKELSERYGEWNNFKTSGEYVGRSTVSSLKEETREFKKVLDCKEKTIGIVSEKKYDQNNKLIKEIDCIKEYGYRPMKFSASSEQPMKIYKRYCH